MYMTKELKMITFLLHFKPTITDQLQMNIYFCLFVSFWPLHYQNEKREHTINFKYKFLCYGYPGFLE